MLKCSCRMVHTLPSGIFKVSAHATSLYDRPKPFCGLFLCFLEKLPNLGYQRVIMIGVCKAVFKISKPPHYRLPRWSRVRATLVKSLLCLNSIFSHQKA